MLLRSGGMSAPDRFAGEVTKVLADAGLFRLRALLVGSVAFSCYSGLLGVRLPGTSMQTGDADSARDFAISAEVEGQENRPRKKDGAWETIILETQPSFIEQAEFPWVHARGEFYM